MQESDLMSSSIIDWHKSKTFHMLQVTLETMLFGTNQQKFTFSWLYTDPLYQQATLASQKVNQPEPIFIGKTVHQMIRLAINSAGYCSSIHIPAPKKKKKKVNWWVQFVPKLAAHLLNTHTHTHTQLLSYQKKKKKKGWQSFFLLLLALMSSAFIQIIVKNLFHYLVLAALQSQTSQSYITCGLFAIFVKSYRN